MAIDGIFLKSLKDETSKSLKNSRIDKIYQPSRDELVILLRSIGPAKKLYINVKPSSSRFSFIDSNPENPATPPMLCMLLRKKLCGAKFVEIEDDGFERIAVFVFEGHNEMGDLTRFKLVVELIGKQPNVILIDENDRIIDSVRRSDIETATRLVQPGAIYRRPERLEKLSLVDNDIDNICENIILNDGSLSRAILNTVDGVSPLVAKEIVVRCGFDIDRYLPLDVEEKKRLKTVLESLKSEIISSDKKGYILVDNTGKPFDFSYTKITQYGNFATVFEKDGLSNLLNDFYSEKDKKERLRSVSQDLFKLVTTLKNRALRKLNVRKKELEACDGSEKYRIYGELIKANIHKLSRGDSEAIVENYYDEMKPTKISLNVALSPAENAQRYFKEYKKLCNAALTLGDLITESEREYQYLESVEEELSRAQTLAELDEIRNELSEMGYIKAQRNQKKKTGGILKPLEFISPDGYKILVGRNNKQNDYLTFKIAEKTDIWLHTKDIPGSHVIILCNNTIPPDSTVEYAAKLAAYHSKAQNSSLVPVDYTFQKYVKKPSGANFGMVIFTNNKTAYVNPSL